MNQASPVAMAAAISVLPCLWRKRPAPYVQVWIGAYDHIAGYHKTLFWEQGVLDAHSTHFEKVYDAHFTENSDLLDQLC